MRVLLDTHVWLWMAAAPERLSPNARALVVDANTELLLSAASAWEIAIKHGLGRLSLPEPPEVFVPRAVRTEPFDNETVLVTGGLEAGTKIVVRNAPLVNQVR